MIVDLSDIYAYSYKHHYQVSFALEFEINSYILSSEFYLSRNKNGHWERCVHCDFPTLI